MPSRPLAVMLVTNMYPSESRPNWGTFVRSQVESLRQLDVEFELIEIAGHRSKIEYLRAIPRVIRESLSGRYDLVHAHYGLSGLVARTQWRLPVVVSFCGDDLYGHMKKNGVPTKTSLFWVFLHKRLVHFVDGVIVKSKAMKALLPECDAQVVANGVDFDQFRPLDRVECRQQLNLSAEFRYVLFPYDPNRIRKNYALVAEAVDQLNAERTADEAETRLIVVNNEPNERLPTYFNASNVLVLASNWEGSPNAVKEALACNIPIVATDVGDVRELIGEVQNCHIADRSATSLAAAIRAALEGAPRTDGRARSSRLQLPRIAERVLEIYRSVL